MAILNGLITSSAHDDTADFTSKPAWMGTLVLFVDVADAYTITLGSYSVITSNLPIDFVGNLLNGGISSAYSDVFYNRILVEPLELDFGNILVETTQEIKVFNAYFESKTLDSISTNNFDGLSLGNEITTPKVFQALEETTQTVTALKTGPINFDSDVTYNFSAPQDVRNVDLLGARIVMFPYPGTAPLTERLVWKSQSYNSYSGDEQRFNLRSKPRQQFSLNTSINNNQITTLENLYYGWRQRLWGVPVWGESVVVAGLTMGQTVINLDTRYSDFRLDGIVIIWNNVEKFEAFNIDAITDTSITIDAELTQDFNKAFVMPVRLCRLLDDPNRQTNGYNGSTSVNFEVTDNIRLTTTASPTQFDSYDVELETPLLEGDFLTDSYTTRINVVDYGTGNVEYFAPWTNNRIIRNYKILLEGLQEIWEFREWLHRRSGKIRPFYMPTFENNLEVLNTGNISSVLNVTNKETESQGSNRIHIALKLSDNTWMLRTVVSYVDNQDGTVDANLDSPLNIDAGQIVFTSYLGLKRLNSDSINIEWLGNEVAEISLSIVELLP